MISDVLDGKIEYNPLSLETTTPPTVVKKLSGIISTDIQSLQSTVTQVCIFLQHRIFRTGIIILVMNFFSQTNSTVHFFINLINYLTGVSQSIFVWEKVFIAR